MAQRRRPVRNLVMVWAGHKAGRAGAGWLGLLQRYHKGPQRRYLAFSRTFQRSLETCSGRAGKSWFMTKQMSFITVFVWLNVVASIPFVWLKFVFTKGGNFLLCSGVWICLHFNFVFVCLQSWDFSNLFMKTSALTGKHLFLSSQEITL